MAATTPAEPALGRGLPRGRWAREGFSDVAAVAGYRAFTSFLLGHLLLEVAALGADLGPLDVVEEDVDPRRLAPYPHVRRLRGPLREDHSATEFEDSLENLLQRLALIRIENRSGRSDAEQHRRAVAEQALVGGDADPGALDLPALGLAAQLPGHLAHLGQRLGRHRLAEAGQPAATG